MLLFVRSLWLCECMLSNLEHWLQNMSGIQRYSWLTYKVTNVTYLNGDNRSFAHVKMSLYIEKNGYLTYCDCLWRGWDNKKFLFVELHSQGSSRTRQELQ